MTNSIEIQIFDGRECIQQWRRHRESMATTRQYPVILGTPKDAERWLHEGVATPAEFSDILNASRDINVEDWFASRQSKMDPAGLSQKALSGDWPQEEIPTQFPTICTNMQTGQWYSEVAMTLVPVVNAWKVPAYFRYGGWNDCPPPEVQCAVMRHWRENYGMWLLGLMPDQIHCLANRPPQTRDAAMELAREQFLFCTDLVIQGTNTLQRLAAELLNQRSWKFWWD